MPVSNLYFFNKCKNSIPFYFQISLLVILSFVYERHGVFSLYASRTFPPGEDLCLVHPVQQKTLNLEASISLENGEATPAMFSLEALGALKCPSEVEGFVRSRVLPLQQALFGLLAGKETTCVPFWKSVGHLIVVKNVWKAFLDWKYKKMKLHAKCRHMSKIGHVSKNSLIVLNMCINMCPG